MKRIFFYFLVACCYSLPALDFRLNGGADKWGFAAEHNRFSQKWNGAPVSVTLTGELFNAPGKTYPVLPWQSWFGILMEDCNNRYVAGMLAPGGNAPEVEYGAVIYEKRGHFSMSGNNRKFQLAAGPFSLRLEFRDSTLTLFAGAGSAAPEEVWKRTVPADFKPTCIGFVLDSAQAKSTVGRLAVNTVEIRSENRTQTTRPDDTARWQRHLKTLEVLNETKEYRDLTDELVRELGKGEFRVPRGNYTFGEISVPPNTALSFAPGAKIFVTGKTQLKLNGGQCSVSGGLWLLPGEERRAPVISGTGLAGVTIRDIVTADFGQEITSYRKLDFAAFENSSDLLVENNRLSGVRNAFNFFNCRRVTVRNNRAMYCERLTLFRDGSETLLHSGNWSSHVRFQCQWWGGDANDWKNNVRKNTARLMVRDRKPGDPEYDANTAGTYDINVENNIADHGVCLAWGSKGKNVVITGNQARFMDDMAYDSEGGENVIIANNLSINSKCAGIGAYFYGSRLLISGNQVLVLAEGEKKYQGGFLRLHSPGENNHFGNGKVFITGNQFINEVNPRAGLSVEAARNIVITGNSFTGGGIRLLAEAEAIVISNNTFETTPLMEGASISFAGKARSMRIVRNNQFINTGRLPFPAINATKQHQSGALVLGNNDFEGFSTAVELNGNGKLRQSGEIPANWKIGTWKTQK